MTSMQTRRPTKAPKSATLLHSPPPINSLGAPKQTIADRCPLGQRLPFTTPRRRRARLHNDQTHSLAKQVRVRQVRSQPLQRHALRVETTHRPMHAIDADTNLPHPNAAYLTCSTTFEHLGGLTQCARIAAHDCLRCGRASFRGQSERCQWTSGHLNGSSLVRMQAVVGLHRGRCRAGTILTPRRTIKLHTEARLPLLRTHT